MSLLSLSHIFMLKKLAYSGLGIVLLASPLLASADQLSDLKTQLQELINQISAVQVQMGTGAVLGHSTSIPSVCVVLNNNLSPGNTDAMKNGEVSKLQQFLQQDGTANFTGGVSGYYGSLTTSAVQRWQTAHGIVSSGGLKSTGYGAVGPATRAAMANCGSTQLPDLSIVTMSATSATVPSTNQYLSFNMDAGQPQWNLQFKNYGGASSNFDVKYAVYDSSGNVVTERTLSQVAAYYLTNPYPFTMLHSYVAGTYTYQISINPTGSIAESNYGNNKLSGGFNVVSNQPVAASIQVTSPNGGEQIDPNKQMDMTYNYAGIKSFSAALYKNDQLKYWIVQDQLIPGPTMSSISWSPSAALQGLGEGDNAGAIFKLYITGQKADGTGYVDDKSDAPFSFVTPVTQCPTGYTLQNGQCVSNPVTTTPAKVTLTGPLGGAIYKIGDSIPTSWSYSDAPSNSQIVVSLKLIQQDGVGSGVSGSMWRSPLITAGSGTGSRNWPTGLGLLEVPGTYELSAAMRQCDPQGCHYFDPSSVLTNYANSTPLRFQVTSSIAPSSIAVVSPNGGEEFIRGQRYTLTWTSSNVTSPVTLSVVSGDTTAGVPIATNVPNTGNYSWTVPLNHVEGAHYLYVSTGLVSDASNNSFKIRAAAQTQTSTCPTGYTLQNGQCVVNSVTTVPMWCPTGSVVQNGQCVQSSVAPRCSITAYSATPSSQFFSAGYYFVMPGSSVTLSWTSTNATSAVLNGQQQFTSGSIFINGVRQLVNSYTMTVYGPGGNYTCSQLIFVK